MKLIINKIITFSIKHHWLCLVVLIVVQYLSGHALSSRQLNLPFPRPTIFQIHQLLGLLILLSAVGLFLAKLYLLYLRFKSSKSQASP